MSKLIGVPYDTIQNLNPELRRGVSPPGQPYTIRLPKGMKKSFEIAYADLPEDQRVKHISVPAEDVAERSSYRPAYRTQVASYTVRRGDTMASLARRYGVSVQEIARMNRLSSRGELRKGQTVRIPQTVRMMRDRHGRKVMVRAPRGRNGREARVSRSSRSSSRHAAARGRTSSHSSNHSSKGRHRR